MKTTQDKPGWLIPYLIGLDEMFYRRWDYWCAICFQNRILTEPIPYIHFRSYQSYPKQEVQKNLKSCLDFAHYHLSSPLDSFMDWLLWGFKATKEPPSIPEKVDDYWYRTFNLGLFYVEPAEHFGIWAMEYMGKNNAVGFFQTPDAVTSMMVQMTFGGDPKREHKTLSVCDPCCGTGIMLLYASNYSLNLYGVDISPLLTKIAKVNAYIYVPWLAFRPKSLTIFDGIIEIDLFSGVRIPHCNRCNRKDRVFMTDIQTPHEVALSENGALTLDTPKIYPDLIAKKLKPSNLKCAHCEREVVV
ncbi:MAG: hypothetical protein CV087_21775 [Candidatus Brocadia sp. WS118]|nr:MAG: hypothetical protein CV087_21775 [Candidatus Brocadia sp. WS118]